MWKAPWKKYGSASSWNIHPRPQSVRDHNDLEGGKKLEDGVDMCLSKDEENGETVKVRNNKWQRGIHLKQKQTPFLQVKEKCGNQWPNNSDMLKRLIYWSMLPTGCGQTVQQEKVKISMISSAWRRGEMQCNETYVCMLTEEL